MNILNALFLFLAIIATAKPVAKFKPLSRFVDRVDSFFHYNYDFEKL